MPVNYAFDDAGVRRIVQAVRRSENAPLTRHGLRTPVHPNSPADWPVACYNASTTDTPGYALMAITGATLPFDDTSDGTTRYVLTVNQPTGGTFYPCYAVGPPEGIPAKSPGRCTVGPLVKFVGDTGISATLGDGWGPKAGQWLATKNGPQCLTVVGLAADSVFAILSPVSQIIAQPSSSRIALGSSGAVKVFAGASGSEADTSFTATVTNFVQDWQTTELAACGDIDGVWYAKAIKRAKARFIFGALTSPLSGSSVSGCSVTLAIDGPSPGTQTVYQPIGTLFSGASGKHYMAAYRPEDDQYYFVWVEC